MDSQRDRIVVQLRKFANGTATGTFQGGSYAFDPDTIRQVINNYKDLADSYNESKQVAERMAKVAPPGNEFVSEAFAEAANASGKSYIAYCEYYKGFFLGEAQKCQDALDAYLGAEEQTVIDLGKTDDGDSPPPV